MTELPNTGNQSVFRALSDPTRREILMHLSLQDMTIGEVVDKFNITRGAVKKHLNILEEGKLISVHARGRERINHLEPHMLKTVADWIDYFSRFWDERLSALADAVEQEERERND